MTYPTSTTTGDFYYCPDCGQKLVEGMYHVCHRAKSTEPATYVYNSKTDIERAIDALNRIADALEKML